MLEIANLEYYFHRRDIASFKFLFPFVKARFHFTVLGAAIRDVNG